MGKRNWRARAQLGLSKILCGGEDCQVAILLSTSDPWTGIARCHKCGHRWHYNGSNWGDMESMIVASSGDVFKDLVSSPCDVEPA